MIIIFIIIVIIFVIIIIVIVIKWDLDLWYFSYCNAFDNIIILTMLHKLGAF